jgi:hypothetical protein
MTVPWIVLTPQCLHHGLDEATTYILWLDNKFRRNQRKLGGRQDHRTEYSDSPIFLRCVLYLHDCAHGDGLRRRQECYEFRRFGT